MPRTQVKNEHPMVMHSAGVIRNYTSEKVYSNNFVIIPILRGPAWETKEELYNPLVVAVFRVITQHEEEIALFVVMVNSSLHALEGLPLHSYTVVPMPVGFKTSRYIHGDGARNYMKEVVFVVAVHTTEGHKERANIIRNELQLVEGETGEGSLREK